MINNSVALKGPGMELNIRGGFGPQRKLVRLMARDILPELIGNRLLNNITLNVSLRKTLWDREKCYGTCDYQDDNLRPRMFLIELDTCLTSKQLMRAFAHELIHLRQYATGQMKDYTRTSVTAWKGRPINNDEMLYEKHPWEKEAYRKEGPVYFKWLQNLSPKKKALVKSIKQNWVRT